MHLLLPSPFLSLLMTVVSPRGSQERSHSDAHDRWKRREREGVRQHWCASPRWVELVLPHSKQQGEGALMLLMPSCRHPCLPRTYCTMGHSPTSSTSRRTSSWAHRRSRGQLIGQIRRPSAFLARFTHQAPSLLAPPPPDPFLTHSAHSTVGNRRATTGHHCTCSRSSPLHLSPSLAPLSPNQEHGELPHTPLILIGPFPTRFLRPWLPLARRLLPTLAHASASPHASPLSRVGDVYIALASLYVRLTCYGFVQAQARADEFNGPTGGEWNG